MWIEIFDPTSLAKVGWTTTDRIVEIYTSGFGTSWRVESSVDFVTSTQSYAISPNFYTSQADAIVAMDTFILSKA